METSAPESLLVAAGRGDATAFEALYASASPRIFGQVLRIVKRRDWAEEVLQEVFVQVWRRAETYQPERGAALAWMSRIARNAAIDLYRRQRREFVLDSDDLLEDLAISAGTPFETTETLNRCLGELEENPRKAILLAYYYGYTHEELSGVFETPLGTLKSWIRRSLIRLKACLES